jgi:DNA-directed RNA polymerase specialized sigma24 family protein
MGRGAEVRHLAPAIAPGEEEESPVSEDVARSAFALLQKLELDAPLKSPSVLTVFRLYCVDGHSANQVARKCRCAKGTVMSRLRFIEAVTKTRPEEFRAMSAHLQRVDDELKASGAREIYRRGLARPDADGSTEED